MFNSFRQNFHLSQATVSATSEHVPHYRPLGLLLLLTLIAWQSGVFSAFAAALPVAPLAGNQGYVYIQHNPLVDDSWIGTRVSLVGVVPASQTSPTIAPTQTIDTSWLGNFTQSKKSPLLGEYILNAAPSIPTPDTTLTYPYPIQYTTPNGTLLNNISSSYSASVSVSLVSSVFGRNGSVIGQSGDYTTTLVTEGTNLYFTDTRAQEALSGALMTLSGQITTNTASIGSLSGSLIDTNSNLATAVGDISTFSGLLVTANTDLLSLSGTVANKIGLTALSALGPLTYNSTTGVFGIDLANSTTSGALSSNDWNTFNSKESVLTFATGITRAGNTIGLTTGADGDILSMASGVPTWVTPAAVSVPVLSVFGRTGSILATLGDYTTSLVTEGSNLYFTQGRFDTAFSGKTTTDLTEGSNLYFTDTRAQDALSGSIANISNSINTLSGSLVSLSSTVDTLSDVVASNYAVLSGALSATNTDLIATNIDLASLSGTVNTLSGFVSTLSTTVSTISGSLVALSSTVDSLSGSLALTDADVSSISGALAALTITVNTLSGTVSTILTDVSTLSGSLAITDSNLAALSGSLATLTSTVDTISGSLISTIATLGSLSSTVATNYTTLSGAIATTNATLASLSGTVAMVQGDVSTLSGTVALLQGLSHDVLTLGTANGLSLSVQQLSLALASATTTGALSATDWNMFNNKIGLTDLSASGGITYNNTTGVFGWNGTTTDVTEGTNLYYTTTRFNIDFSGRSTTNLTEGTNLYFTDTRAQEALSGTMNTLSGNIATATTNIAILSGQIAINTTNIGTLSGSLATTNSNLMTTNSNLTTLSGVVATKIGLTDLSVGGGITYNNTTGVFGWNGTTTNVAEGTNLYYTTTRANTDFDTRLATKSTTNLAEGTNLYFTDARARTALSITGPLTYNNSTGVFGINQSSTSTDGYLSSTNWNTFNNKIGTIGTANGLSIVGTGISLALAGTSSTGALSAIDWNAFNNKESVLTFGTGITRVGNIVGLTNTGITFAIGTTGTDMNWSTAFTALGGTATLNIPDAGLAARGLVSTGSQVFAGAKTFATAPTLSGFTLGSVLFASTGGLITQDNTNFFFDITSKRLGIGTATPVASLELRGTNVTSPNNTGAITNAIFRMRGNTNHSLDFGTFNNSPYGAWIQSVDHTNMSNNLPLALNPNGGNIGIGISAPTAALHVQNNLITTTNLLTLTATGLTTGNALQIIGSGSRNLLRISQNTTDPLDIERVTIGQGGISATKPDGLARDQLYVFGRINSSWNSMSEDFMTRRANAVVANDATFNNALYFDDATGGGAAAGWQVDIVTSPGISGMARLSTQTTGVNFNSRLMTSTNVTQRSLNPVFEARVLGTITANHRIQVGFANTTVGSTWTADATYGGQTDGIFFRKNAAGTVWQTVTRAGGVETTNNTAMSTNAYRTLRIEVNNVVGNATFYIDGVLQFTHTTNLPAVATALGYGIGTAMSAATAGLTVDIDYIRVWSDDPPAVLDSLEPGQEGYISDLFIPTLHDTEIEDTLDFITTQNIVTTLSRFLDATGTGVLDTNRTISGDNTMDLADTGNYLVRLIKQLIERLSEVWLEMRLYVRSLRTEEITTEKLCIGETCITEDELKELLQSRGVQSSSSSSSSVYVVPTTETNTGSTDITTTGAIEPTPDVSSDTVDSISTEPIPVIDTIPDDTIIADTIVAPDAPIIP